MRKIVLIVISVVLLIACSGNQYSHIIDSADSLLNINQDSALSALRLLDKLQPHYYELSKSDQMRFQLIYAKGMNKGYIDFHSDSVLQEVVTYYDAHGSSNDRMLANYLLGCAYRDMNDAPASLECYLRATEQADTMSKDCDYKILARIFGQIGDLYLRQEMLSNSKQAYKKGEQYAWMAKDTLSALIYLESQVNAMRKLQSPNQVVHSFNKVYNEYLKYGYKKEAARALGISIGALILTNQYSLAKKYMDIYERESGYFGKGLCPQVRYYTYFYNKGLYYLDQNRDSARLYFEKCMDFAGSAVAKCIAYDGFIKYFHQYHQLDSVEKYSLLFIKYNDSARIQNEMQTISKMTALYNYNRWQNVAQTKAHEKEKTQMMLSYILIIIGLVVWACVICAFLVYKNLQKKKVIRNEQMLFINQQISAKEAELKDCEKTLREMKRQVCSASLAITEKENVITVLKEEIAALKNDDTFNDEEKPRNQMFFQHKAIVIKFKQLADKGIVPSSQQWSVLENLFASFFANFKRNLETSNKLNENEFHICMLVWLGFTPNQIKVLMAMSSSNVSNIRKRLALKIFCKDFSTRKFDKEIRNIQFEGNV